MDDSQIGSLSKHGFKLISINLSLDSTLSSKLDNGLWHYESVLVSNQSVLPCQSFHAQYVMVCYHVCAKEVANHSLVSREFH